MEIKRNYYLQQLIDRQWNGMVKIITGIRRCGKSYLLRTLFRNYLLEQGVKDEQIIHIELDLTKNIRYRNPIELADYVHSIIDGKSERYYLFIDEIQMSEPVKNPYLPDGKNITFYDTLNEFKEIQNLDVYVTGSNSKMLSTDILTEFRGRGDEIRIHPLTFAEFYSAVGGDKKDAFDQYAFFGGMPLIINQKDDGAKMAYLNSLFSELYLKDIAERKKIEYPEELAQVLDLLCSAIGSLTNPSKIADTILSKKKVSISANTLRCYLDYLKDSFLFTESKRYDVKGKAYFEYPMKYYCEDIGLRNARTGFRQMEMTHIMENIIFNELRVRNFSVDVGIVYENGKNKSGNNIRIQREIDFIASKGNKKVYIQSAFAMPDAAKQAAELKPFSLTGDLFPKIIIRNDIGKSWYDDNGVLNISLIDFLLDQTII
ncbi:MAG: ATP-binding protein [Lentisphaeria bacterium]|nr:ATP-binding protein [Lentisphaeria bacterium]